ncbi:MAG: alkyl hydroperoxide reductase/Thiol specific antioxidant/Mal allergen [Myxococcales bacterium]|nr:alkyl hydroperoxide reductase/Thiol specific antioxidant/Mal allergen [Myxococcales bacterium]
MTGPGRLMAMRFLLIAVVLVTASRAHADELKVGDRLAELDTATDVSGKAFKLKALKGKWTMVTFGASWCKPCKKELPAWDALAPDWKGKVSFVAVDLDTETDTGKKFHKELKLKNMTLVYLSPDSAIAAKYGADHMPTTVLADPQGVIRYIRGGFEKGDISGEVKKMREELQKLVK